MEIVLKLTADPKLETLLDKLCNALDLGNGLPFTASQVAPAKPAPVVPTVVPAATTTAVRAVPVNPTPSTPVATTAPLAQPAIVSNAPTAMPANTAPVATPAPVTTTVSTAAPGAPVAQQQTTVPTAAPTNQIADLARAAATLMDAGKQPQLLALLAQFGVQSLGQLKPEQFGQFATALRGLGAKL